jgi:hypothetical protein
VLADQGQAEEIMFWRSLLVNGEFAPAREEFLHTRKLRRFTDEFKCRQHLANIDAPTWGKFPTESIALRKFKRGLASLSITRKAGSGLPALEMNLPGRPVLRAANNLRACTGSMGCCMISRLILNWHGLASTCDFSQMQPAEAVKRIAEQLPLAPPVSVFNLIECFGSRTGISFCSPWHFTA